MYPLRPPSERNVAATNIIIIVPYISFYPQMKEDTENKPLLMDKDKYVTVWACCYSKPKPGQYKARTWYKTSDWI